MAVRTQGITHIPEAHSSSGEQKVRQVWTPAEDKLLADAVAKGELRAWTRSFSVLVTPSPKHGR